MCRCHGQQATVFHHEFDPDIAHGADGFAFLQFVANFQGAADACGVDGEYGAIAIDGGDCCELGHEILQLKKRAEPQRLRTTTCDWRVVGGSALSY